MSDSLTIHCDTSPDDILVVELVNKIVRLTICDAYAGTAQLVLNRQSVQELYDLLGEFLADDQR